MKKINNKYVKKIWLVTFTLIAFALGIFNIKAEVTVMGTADFETQLADSTVQYIKLGADITPSGMLTVKTQEADGWKKIIDLNGHNITASGSNLEFSTGIQTNELQIINSSSNSSTITADWGIEINPQRDINAHVDSYKNFRVVIKNVDLKYPATAWPLIYFNANSPASGGGTIPRINLEVEISNSNLTGGKDLFKFTKAISDVSFNLDNLSYEGGLETSKFYDGENVSITYNQILGAGQAYYVDGNLVSLDGSANVEAEGRRHEIKAKEEGFSITPIKIDLTYGYTQADIDSAEVSVSIMNNYSESKTINKSQLSVPSDFIITGPDTITINPGETNLEFKIKANGLGKIAGGINNSIEIKEGSDTIASTNVVLEIQKAEYTFNVSLDNWVTGETPNDVIITGVPEEISSEITPTYKYEGISGTSYVLSEIVPTEVGDYELTVRYDATGNYLSSNSKVSFKILPGKELITTKELLGVNVYNYKEAFTLTDFSDFKIQIQKSGTNITLPYTVYTYNQPTSNFVGTTYVMIGIKISDDDYLKYEFNGGSQTLEHTYQIIIEGTTPEFTFSPNNINSSTDTSLSLTKGTTSNLDLNGKVIVNNNKQDVVYSLAQDYAGKVLITDNKLQVASDFEGDLIEINASVAGVDLNGDSHNEYNENSTTIYVKMIDKTILTISGIDDNQTFDYDGNKKTPVGTILVQDNLLPTSDLVITYNGTGTTTYDSSDAPVNVGTYQVTYQINPTNPNYSGLVTYNFTISKSNPPYILPTDLTAKIGETLASVTLPTGFNWKDSSLVINEKLFKADATYDSGNSNYNLIDVEITINANYYYDVNTIVSGDGGTATDKTDILEGTSYTVIFTPDTGYQIDTVTVNGIYQTVIDNKLTLVIDENKEVKVRFKKIKYNINVDSPLGIILDKPGLTTVEYGASFTLNLKTELGYKLINVKVNGIDLTSTIIGDILSLTNISENKDITFNLEKIEYEVIKGSNQEVLINNKKDAEFQINAEVDLFEKVYINGTLLDPSNYAVTKGSTIITLKEAYLATLKNGKYVMTVLFSDGGKAKTNFTINRENETESPKTTVPSTNVNNQETNPRTEDSISNYIILMITSLFAFLSTTYLLKKHKKEV